MSKPKRSRTTSNVLRLDAGRKEHTTPSKPAPADPAPLIPCLKVKVIMGNGRGEDSTLWVDVANYPAEGGLEAFYDLIHRAPDDSFMTADAGGSIAFASIVAIRRPKESDEEYPVKAVASPPGAPKRLYQRLEVATGSGRQEIVGVANVPWTENGIAHFARVIGKFHSSDFVTTEFGFMPVSGVKLHDLVMPGDAPERKVERFSAEEILRLEDLPE